MVVIEDYCGIDEEKHSVTERSNTAQSRFSASLLGYDACPTFDRDLVIYFEELASQRSANRPELDR